MTWTRNRSALFEAVRRARVKSSWGPQLLFGPQRDYCLDPSRSKLAICSRRSGKTTGNAWMMVDAALKHERVGVPYVTLTRKSQSARAMWNELDRLNDVHQLRAHLNNIEKVMTFPNKSYIFIAGADDKRTIERLRGDKAPGIVVDEAQSFGPSLQNLVEDALEPSLLDMRGWLALSGTPGRVCAGYFYEACVGKIPGWSHHEWTVTENPHIPHAAEDLLALRVKRKWEENNPTYLREWRGVWVDDPNGTVYRVKDLNILAHLPEADDWHYILGIDVGFKDSSAFCVLAWSERLRLTVIVECWSKPGMTPSDVAEQVTEYRGDYDFDRIVIDSGGMGKGYQEEMRQRHQLPVEAANKRKKTAYIDHLNGELVAQHLKVVGPTSQQLLHEWRELPWKDETRTKIDDSLIPDHCADAALYGWRECKAWLPRPEDPPAPTGPDPVLGPRTPPTTNEEMRAYWEELAVKREQAMRDPYGLEAAPEDWFPEDFPA